MQAGYNWQEASEKAGIKTTRPTAYSWWKKYREQGESGLREDVLPKAARDLHDIFAVFLVSSGQQSSCACIQRRLLGSAATIDHGDPGSLVAPQTQPGTPFFQFLNQEHL